MKRLANVYRLGVKELWSLWRDRMMLVLILYTFSLAVYTSASAIPETLYKAPIAIVDEDGSQLSQRIISAFYPPHFLRPRLISIDAVDAGLDAGEYTFVLDIPPGFQRDVLAGRAPTIQLNVDATRMSQAFSGSGYIQQIAMEEVNEFMQRYRAAAATPVELAVRMRFNPNLSQAWFGAILQIIDNVTMLSIVLAGAALIREREHGTVEHLLVMPVRPAEIMLAKIWSMSLVVLIAAGLSLQFVVRGVLHIPIEGSVALFLLCAALHLLAMTSLGVFMATIARSMPQFALLLMLTIMPLQMLSGGTTPRESMPEWVQFVMNFAPTTHFIIASQAILFRGAGFQVVWPQMLAIMAIGTGLFAYALRRFRKTIALMA